MKKITVVLLVAIILSTLIGCSNEHIRYQYQGDYKQDPTLKHDVDRDRTPGQH